MLAALPTMLTMLAMLTMLRWSIQSIQSTLPALSSLPIQASWTAQKARPQDVWEPVRTANLPSRPAAQPSVQATQLPSCPTNCPAARLPNYPAVQPAADVIRRPFALRFPSHRPHRPHRQRLREIPGKVSGVLQALKNMHPTAPPHSCDRSPGTAGKRRAKPQSRRVAKPQS